MVARTTPCVTSADELVDGAGSALICGSTLPAEGADGHRSPHPPGGPPRGIRPDPVAEEHHHRQQRHRPTRVEPAAPLELALVTDWPISRHHVCRRAKRVNVRPTIFHSRSCRYCGVGHLVRRSNKRLKLTTASRYEAGRSTGCRGSAARPAQKERRRAVGRQTLLPTVDAGPVDGEDRDATTSGRGGVGRSHIGRTRETAGRIWATAVIASNRPKADIGEFRVASGMKMRIAGHC